MSSTRCCSAPACRCCGRRSNKARGGWQAPQHYQLDERRMKGGKMAHRIFLAGAAGAIGKRLAPLLREAGHTVTGTTRSEAKAETLRRSGVEAAVVDVFDAAGLMRAIAAARPDIVIHQLTDLPRDLDPRQ